VELIFNLFWLACGIGTLAWVVYVVGVEVWSWLKR
jgi:hypothetical protein